MFFFSKILVDEEAEAIKYRSKVESFVYVFDQVLSSFFMNIYFSTFIDFRMTGFIQMNYIINIYLDMSVIIFF